MYRLLLALSLCFVSACSKDSAKPESCDLCPLIIANGEIFPYEVTFAGWGADAPGKFTLSPTESRSFQMPAGKDISINGKLLTNFAHNDFSETVRCPGDCSTRTVLMKM